MSRVCFAMVALMVLVSPEASANTSNRARFDGANTAWFDGDTKAACAGYRTLVADLGDVPELHYNLGVCALSASQLGRAVYHFEKAALGRQTEEAAKTALSFAWTAIQARHKDRIEKGIYRYDTGHGMGYAIFTLVPEWLLLLLFALFALPTLAALFTWSFARQSRWVATGRIAFLSGIIPALILGGLYFGQLSYVSSHSFAIVVAEEAQFLDAPDANAPSTPLPEGLKVRVLLHNEQGFYKVQRGADDIGYVQEDQLGVL